MKLESIGIIISLRKFQESKYIISCLTKDHGIITGITRRPSSSKASQPLVPGNIGLVSWHARLEDQLGTINMEVIDHISARLHNDSNKLSILQAILSLISIFMTEREKYDVIFEETQTLLDLMEATPYYQSIARYCLFELKLLEEIGFGLDLRKCTVSNNTDNLVYVSPKTGCAVSYASGKAYHDKLFPLPPLLLNKGDDYTKSDLLQALKLTGFFLHRAAAAIGKESHLAVRNHLLPGLIAAQQP